MSFFFKKPTQAASQTIASGLNIQSSAYGGVIPLVYGITRLAGNLIWYGDFNTVATTSSPSSGGGKGGVGGGGGGKGGGGTTTYTYNTAFAMGLCEGPIGGVRLIYIDKNIYNVATAGFTEFFGTYPQTPWGYLTTNHPGQNANSKL